MKMTAALLLAAFAAAMLPGVARAELTINAPTALKVGVSTHYGFMTTDRILVLSHQSCWPHLATMSGYHDAPIPTMAPIEPPPGYPRDIEVNSPYRYGIAFDLLPTGVGECSLTLLDNGIQKHIEITIRR